jgi:A/G-specific adenine glycosylase
MDPRVALLAWYRARRRRYPWRVRPDPYRVLVSEIMLQQTQADRVAPAFARFVQRFPTVTALADAPRADVLRAWGTLGYNRRAVALSEAARAIVREHDGRVPKDIEALRRLPGLGPYTAAAVASLGHGAAVAAVDVNVRRVVSRMRLGVDAGGVSEAEASSAAQSWLDTDDPGAWNQALMDLGRDVCRPEPRCDACPLVAACAWHRAGRPATDRGRRIRGRQSRFEGSFRQVRGGVVAVLRVTTGWTTVRLMARRLGRDPEEVGRAVSALSSEGLIETDAAGRVRLAHT